MDETELVFPILLTAKTCLVSLALFLCLAVPLAFWLSRRKDLAAKIVDFLVTLPLVFPPIALGYLFLLVFGKSGWLGSVFNYFGWRFVFSQTGVIFAAFIAGLPLVVRPLQVAFESQKLRELEEAAFICGASKLRTFFVVSLPLAKNALLVGLLLGLARASGEVGITMMLGGNISDRTNTLSLEIYNSVARGDFETATFLCLLLAGFAFLIYLILYFIQSKKAF